MKIQVFVGDEGRPAGIWVLLTSPEGRKILLVCCSGAGGTEYLRMSHLIYSSSEQQIQDSYDALAFVQCNDSSITDASQILPGPREGILRRKILS